MSASTYFPPFSAPTDGGSQLQHHLNAAHDSSSSMLRDKGGAAVTLKDNYGDNALVTLRASSRRHFHWFEIFIFISFSLSFSETLLIAWPESTYTAQKVILALSTSTFIFSFFAMMWCMPKELSLIRRFRETLLPEVSLELIGLAWGWGFLFQRPGLASLRCFRIFRFVWYSEEYRAQYDSERKDRFYIITHFGHLIVTYLDKMGRELFTFDSKGGVVVLGFYFYLAYIIAVTIHLKLRSLGLGDATDTGSTAPVARPIDYCSTLNNCYFTMIRLSLYDGNGFDFVKALMDNNQQGLVVLLMLYTIASAFILLNGLIGIFGGAFQAATVEAGPPERKDKTATDLLNDVDKLREELESQCATIRDEMEILKKLPLVNRYNKQ